MDNAVTVCSLLRSFHCLCYKHLLCVCHHMLIISQSVHAWKPCYIYWVAACQSVGHCTYVNEALNKLTMGITRIYQNSFYSKNEKFS